MKTTHDPKQLIKPNQVLNTLTAIVESNGYRETEGDNWLGPRLALIHDFVLQHFGCDADTDMCPFCATYPNEH